MEKKTISIESHDLYRLIIASLRYCYTRNILKLPSHYFLKATCIDPHSTEKKAMFLCLFPSMNATSAN